MYKNSDTACLNKAIKALKTLEMVQDEPFIVLKEKLAEIARKGSKQEFRWRHLLIRYFQEPSRFYFKVSNPYTGVTSIYITKDYMTKGGDISWKRLASAVKHT